jgi:hypothetical protein
LDYGYEQDARTSGGNPYDYDSVNWLMSFDNPGYQIDAQGNPQPIENNLE